MKTYWTCSKFADWIRGTTMLKSGTSEQWAEWKRRAKTQHPIRYWIAEEGLDRLQDVIVFVPNAIYSLKYYINNRWVTRTHALTAHPRDIKPGEWRDVGDRFLPCLFNELVDYVEQELAWWHIAWADPSEKHKYKAPFWATGWFRWRAWRCAQAGLDNLEWQRSLVYDDTWMVEQSDPRYGQPTAQAIDAQEILDLYKWWTEVYHNRPDPHDASGYSDYCERKRQLDGDDGFFSQPDSAELRELGDRALKACNEIEAAYEAEDQQMMIRLVKIRNALWT